jgi:hypothetical protein
LLQCQAAKAKKMAVLSHPDMLLKMETVLNYKIWLCFLYSSEF